MISNSLSTRNILVVNRDHFPNALPQELEYLANNFYGHVVPDLSDIEEVDGRSQVFLTGKIGQIKFDPSNIDLIDFRIVREFSTDIPETNIWGFVRYSEIPIVLPSKETPLGLHFRNLFDSPSIFETIKYEHNFQKLTESNKPDVAMRTGLYITKVSYCYGEPGPKFHLMRCSSNFAGPTESTNEIDDGILSVINGQVLSFFESRTSCNHILAQIYENSRSEEGREKRATIKAHSDKTKDMDLQGVIAFCTFYASGGGSDLHPDTLRAKNIRPSKKDPFDLCYDSSGRSEVSILTRLRFKLKKSVTESLPSQFEVTLYPGSVFIIPLSTNRLYTHEIVPSTLPIHLLPTRMGYVVRCSNVEALHINGQTQILSSDGQMKILRKPTEEDVAHLKDLYLAENKGHDKVDYGEILFSLNDGDYLAPH